MIYIQRKKKVFGFINTAIIALLFAACGGNADNKTDGKDNAGKDENSAQTKTPISDIAFIKVDSVIQNYDMYHDLKAEFEKEAKKLEAEFDIKVKAFENDYKKHMEKREKMLLTRSQEQEEEAQLMMRQQELRDKIAPKLQADLTEKQNVFTNTVIDAVMKYINKYNEEKKYALILNGSAVLTGHPSMDITSEVLKGLNQEYIASKATK
ncbi:MAG: OmpH family outer membrane protein [Prevotellaceae bacterium]|jgi:outer membrane protein|nr:OmpH family outer membrane protein [Prevotellaceae bacterium]